MLRENLEDPGLISGLDESASFAVDKARNYEDLNFKSVDDDNTQFELFANIKNLDKARKLQKKDKSVSELDIDAKLVETWMANVDKIVYLSDVCERDGSLNPDNIDNILVNVFKMKQLIEHVRLHPDYVVKYGVAGISVPFNSLYSNINEAIEYVKAGISSDKRLQTAISSMFIVNNSIMTTDNATGMKISDIVAFHDDSSERDHTFDIDKKLISDCKLVPITEMLDLVDIAASLFVIDKAVLIVDSDALVISDDYKRTGAFKEMCAILASMMIMFIEEDTIDFSLLDRMQ